VTIGELIDLILDQDADMNVYIRHPGGGLCDLTPTDIYTSAITRNALEDSYNMGPHEEDCLNPGTKTTEKGLVIS
jgi:hypothetical protein